MSAEVEAVGFLVGLGILAAGVILPALPAASRRVKAMQRTRESRQREAVAILSMPSVSPSRADRTGADVAANWHCDERATVPLPGDTAQAWAVERPAGDTQEWEIQERVLEPEPEVEAKPVEPEVPYWMRPALEDEPTPLAPGPVPQLPSDLDPNTIGWNRAEYLQRLRRYEFELLEQARGERAA